MRRLALLLMQIAAGAFAAPALASSSTSNEQFAEVRARIAEARGLVDESVAAAEAGDRERAYDIARTAYLEHFEKVEHPLGEEDHELMEELEEAISTDLRNDIKDGKSTDEIEAAVAAINTDLDRAVVLLQS